MLPKNRVTFRQFFSRDARHARRAPRQRRASVLLMTLVYLLMFAALATSMVAFSQGNMQLGDAESDSIRALAAAESGMSYLLVQFQKNVTLPAIKEGSIANMSSVNSLWAGTNIEGISGNNGIAVVLASAFNNSGAFTGSPVVVPTGTSDLNIPAMNVDSANDHSTFTLNVSWDSNNPYPSSYSSYCVLHLKSTGYSGQTSRTVAMDLWVQKVFSYAVYSNVAIQLGKNVHVIGDIASTYAGTGKGPPVQMFSNLHDLTNSGNIDSSLYKFRNILNTYDSSHTNRISPANTAGWAAATAAGYADVNGDGYIDENDIALQKFGSKVNPGHSQDPWGITQADFTDPRTGNLYDPDYFTLTDSPQGPASSLPSPPPGYGDGVIDYQDDTSKVDGSIKMAIPYSGNNSWTSAASGWTQWGDTTGGGNGGRFVDQFEGPVNSTATNPVQFGVDFGNQQTLSPQNFDTSSYDAQIPNQTATQNGSNISNGTLTAAMANGGTVTEHSPASVSSGWQATYSRPVFQNMTFNNVRIPQGLNAKFVNCTFNGYTSVKLNTKITKPGTNTTTTDPSQGMSWAQQVSSGSFTANGVSVTRYGRTTVTPLNASNSTAFTQGNNLHFSGCTFTGVLTADVPTAYTHFADSWEFDGTTTFSNTTDASVTILAPNTNIEVGGYTNPNGNPSTLVGAVVAGNIDIRGTAVVDGSLIVTGNGAANTTLGYFGSTDQGQGVPSLSQLPSESGGTYGHMLFQLNQARGMPNGITIPVVASPKFSTYQVQ